MAIYKGSKKISKIFVGSKEIKKVYKGSQLVYNGVQEDYGLVVNNCFERYYGYNGGMSETLPPEQLDTRACENFGSMFRDCFMLSTVITFDTSAGTSFTQMFDSCASLVHAPIIDLSNITSFIKVATMFRNTHSLQSVAFTSDVVPPRDTNMFRDSGITATTGTIYVPDALLTEWSESTNWVLYKTRFKPLSERAGDLGI